MSSSQSFILSFIRVILTCELSLSLLTYEPLSLGCVHFFPSLFQLTRGWFSVWKLIYTGTLNIKSGPSCLLSKALQLSQLIPPQLHLLLCFENYPCAVLDCGQWGHWPRRRMRTTSVEKGHPHSMKLWEDPPGNLGDGFCVYSVLSILSNIPRLAGLLHSGGCKQGGCSVREVVFRWSTLLVPSPGPFLWGATERNTHLISLPNLHA